MGTYEFILRVTGLGRELTGAELDALYEAGLGDAGIEHGPLGVLADVTREAPSRAEAVALAAAQVCAALGVPRSSVILEG